jgi:two-component system sensor kinase FixL
MTRLDHALEFAETHRTEVCAVAGVMVALIAWADWRLPDASIGYLYLLPLLLASAALNGVQILTLALVCAILREIFDPAEDSLARLMTVTIGFAMTGFFVAEVNHRRRLLMDHLNERRDADLQLRILIDTSPLAILTLDDHARIRLANASARDLFGFADDPQGQDVQPYLPLLERLLHSHYSGGKIRTSLECNGQRCNGEVFLAHVWLSTYRLSGGPGLAAVVWDASEQLRDREGAGLDSLMATSRVLIGALSHEIRNLASAAASAHAGLGNVASGHESYQALGTLIRGLEKIAASGLTVASAREAAITDLRTVLDEARIVIEPSLREAGISVAWEVGGDLPRVQADHHSLLQVFVNLARNSIRALENSPSREVSITAGLESEMVVVRFRDTGPGVERPELLFKAFQPGADSHGLGLYISRAILRAHGGGLQYEAQPAGSCFTVELWPVEKSAA